MDTKEAILTYVRQFETDAATIGEPDRTRRTLLNRIHDRKDSKEVYAELIQEGLIHETGKGRPGDPIIVNLGYGPDKPVIVPSPWSFIEQYTIIQFMLRMSDEYDAHGWDNSILDIKEEIKKALAAYTPDRPY